MKQQENLDNATSVLLTCSIFFVNKVDSKTKGSL